MKVHVHIDRVVLHGLPIEARSALVVQQAVQSELARLLTEGGLAPAALSGGAVPVISTAAFSVPRAATPAAIGEGLAQSLYGGLGR